MDCDPESLLPDLKALTVARFKGTSQVNKAGREGLDYYMLSVITAPPQARHTGEYIFTLLGQP